MYNTKKSNLCERIANVSQLVEGFESPFGLELLSTVHWVIKNESFKSKNDLLYGVYSWNNLKRKFTPRQMYLAAHVLSKHGWVDPYWT